MTNQEYIDMQYLADRYLQHLSLEDLVQRTVDVLSNYPILGVDGKMGLYPIAEDGKHWFTLFCNIMTEMELRNEQFPDGFLKGAPVPKPTWPEMPKGAEAMKTTDLTGDYLFKFGKECHLRPMLKKGKIRIAPASSYDDPSLNKAVQDKELEGFYPCETFRKENSSCKSRNS